LITGVGFIQRGNADIHAKHNTAIDWASENGHIEVVKYLINNVQDFNKIDDNLMNQIYNLIDKHRNNNIKNARSDK
jgi:ankyrin repeat protein